MKDDGGEDDDPASSRRGWSLSAWCVVAAFGTYFCMYAFRKPFTAGLYADDSLAGIDYKIVLVTAQALGYTLAKFLGIKLVAEVRPQQRAALLLAMIGGAEMTLLLFGLTPVPFNALWLFCNGVLLGMVFGLVLGFLEGRRHTEALAAGLCTSFIVADGVTKSVAVYLLKEGVSEYWMPFTAGLLFVPPLLFFVGMLAHIPAPSRQDIAARSERTPMSAAERRAFARRYALGLSFLVLGFALITILRSVRADFAREIWAGLQTDVPADVYGWSEIVVGACVLVLNGSAVLLRDNRRAFFAALALGIGGTLLIAAALLGLQAGVLPPFAFMVYLGLGLYLPYIAVHTTVFERLIAMTRDRGNIGYLMYLADTAGYLGYVVVLFARNLLEPAENFLAFFVTLSWAIAAATAVLLILCWRYFAIHPATRSVPRAAPAQAELASESRSA